MNSKTLSKSYNISYHKVDAVVAVGVDVSVSSEVVFLAAMFADSSALGRSSFDASSLGISQCGVFRLSNGVELESD